MDRKFGVELELVGITREQAVGPLPEWALRYAKKDIIHETRRHWKIVQRLQRDGRIRGCQPRSAG